MFCHVLPTLLWSSRFGLRERGLIMSSIGMCWLCYYWAGKGEGLERKASSVDSNNQANWLPCVGSSAVSFRPSSLMMILRFWKNCWMSKVGVNNLVLRWIRPNEWVPLWMPLRAKLIAFGDDSLGSWFIRLSFRVLCGTSQWWVEDLLRAKSWAPSPVPA